jgi:K+-sensing histidine kinase KdpD
VRPEHLGTWSYRPPVVITDLRVGGKPVPAGRFNASAELSIEPGANSFALEFSALDYSAPERNRYAYKLDGFDSNWTETDASRRLAAYTNLPPGKYTLQLRGSNRNGEFTGTELALPVNVLPAWYQAMWWRTLVVLAALAMMVAIVRLRTAHLRHRKLELENEVKRQTATLLTQQSELLAANNELALSNDTLRQLGDVGRDITGNLDTQAVFKALHRHVASLLDAGQMSIYQYDRTNRQLDLSSGGAQGEAAALHIGIDDTRSHVALAARERREVSVQAVGTMRSSEYAPLIVNDRLLGVMVVQSSKEHAYGVRERLIFGTLCAYGAIAIINAQARQTMVQQEKLASLGGLVAGMAHGMNTPLGTVVGAISGASEALEELRAAVESGKVNRSLLNRTISNVADFTGLAERNAIRAADLVDSFKSMATQRDSEHAELLDMSQYLLQVSTLVRRHLEQQGHRVKIEVDAALRVQTIPDALNEVMTRVLANVADHAFEAGRYGTVRISARRLDDGRTEIVVADDGQGIAAQDVGRVFDPFFTTRSGSGNHVGLGLNVAFNHVTERLKGSITVDSTPGAGTTVTIRI